VSTYVDTSTLIKLLIDEPGSERAGEIWDRAQSLVSVTLTEVEARSALAAAHRHRRLTMARYRKAVDDLGYYLEQVERVAVTPELVTAAGHVAEAEGLRAYDAVHLTSAIVTAAEVLTSADGALLAAAARRGLATANPLA
jgi:predicted nucleic acid-binding protein